MTIITPYVSRFDPLCFRASQMGQNRFSASTAMPIGIARQLKKSHLRAHQISEGLAKRGITVSRQWQKETLIQKLDCYPTQRKSPRSWTDLGD